MTTTDKIRKTPYHTRNQCPSTGGCSECVIWFEALKLTKN